MHWTRPLAGLAVAFASSSAPAQGLLTTGFTYQGALSNAGAPANGSSLDLFANTIGGEGLLHFKLNETTPGNAHTIIESTLGSDANAIPVPISAFSMNRGVISLHWAMPGTPGPCSFQTRVWNNSLNNARYWSTTLIVQFIPRGM